MSIKIARLAIRLDEDAYARIKRAAAKDERTISSWVRKTLLTAAQRELAKK